MKWNQTAINSMMSFSYALFLFIRKLQFLLNSENPLCVKVLSKIECHEDNSDRCAKRKVNFEYLSMSKRTLEGLSHLIAIRITWTAFVDSLADDQVLFRNVCNGGGGGGSYRATYTYYFAIEQNYGWRHRHTYSTRSDRIGSTKQKT